MCRHDTRAAAGLPQAAAAPDATRFGPDAGPFPVRVEGWLGVADPPRPPVLPVGNRTQAKPRTLRNGSPPSRPKRGNARSVTQKRPCVLDISPCHIECCNIEFAHDCDTFIALDRPTQRPSYTLRQF